ncbi:DUF6049 family protein [Calidifontibacter terrae]
MRAGAAWIVAVLLLLGFGLFLPGTAQATDTATVRLDPTASLISSGASDLVVKGTISSGSALSNATVAVNLSTRLVDTVSTVGSWYDGTSKPAMSQVGTTHVGPVTANGSASFTVTVPKAKLPTAYNLAALPMSITVSDGGRSVGSLRTTMELQRKAPTTPMALDVVVPLTLPADPALFGPTGDARTAAWVRAIGPGSRVNRLLTAFQGLPVTWVVDPALLEPAAASDVNVPAAPSVATDTQSPAPTTSSSAPTTTTPTTTTTTATPTTTRPTSTSSTTSSGSPTASSTAASTTSTSSTSESASASNSGFTSVDISQDPAALLGQLLLGRLQQLGSGQSVWWTAYDDPDVSVLQTASKPLLQRRLAIALPSALSAISTTRVILPVDDLTTASLTAITSAWKSATGSSPVALLPLRTVANSSSAIQTSQRKLSGTAGALFYSEDLTTDLTSTDPATGAQKFLANSLAIYQQFPSRQRSLSVVLPRSTTATPGTLAAAVRATTGADWMATRTTAQTDQALRSAPSATLLRTPQKPPAPAPATPLDHELLSILDRQRRRMDVISAILVDSDDVVTDRSRALDVVGSTRWRSHGSDLQATSGLLGDGLRGIVQKVYVKPSPVNFFADSGKLPLTITNDLNRPVHAISVELQPRKYLLRIKRQPAAVDLRAKSRTTLRAEVVAIAPGDVTVDVHLSDSAGRPVGTPNGVTQLKVSVRPTSSWIYWVLGIVAVLALVIGLLRSLRKGPRRQTVDPTTGTATPRDAIVAASRPAAVREDEPTDHDPRTPHEGTPDP